MGPLRKKSLKHQDHRASSLTLTAHGDTVFPPTSLGTSQTCPSAAFSQKSPYSFGVGHLSWLLQVVNSVAAPYEAQEEAPQAFSVLSGYLPRSSQQLIC